MGDVVVFEGTGSTFPSGNRLVHGEQGVVTGPYSITSVAVKFPSNDGNVSCLVTSLTNLRLSRARHLGSNAARAPSRRLSGRSSKIVPIE